MVGISDRIKSFFDRGQGGKDDVRKQIDRRPFPTAPTGASGTKIYAGYFDEEYLQAIQGLQGADLYDEMRRSDSQVAMLLSAVKNPIRSAKWTIEAVDDSDEEKEIADFVNHLIFKDISNPRTGKRKTFKAFLDEAMTFIEFGYSVFEVVTKPVMGHEEYDDYIGLRDLGFRSQRSIEEWNLNPDGSIKDVRQVAYGDLEVDANIPGKHLIVFSINKEGDNYEGVSMLRPCYGNFFRKNNYLKFQAIGIEKTSTGVPVGQMSDEFMNRDDYDEQFAKLEEVLESFAVHDTHSITLPAGVTISEIKLNFDAEKVQKAIDAEDVKMTKRFLANFMELGVSGGGGSYSLGSDLSDIFLGGIEYIADMICEGLNPTVIPNLVRAKYGARKEYPKLVYRGINDKAGKELAEIINGFIDKGVIKPSDRLEAFVHDVYGLPEITAEQKAEEEEQEDDTTPPENDPEPEPQPDPQNEPEEKDDDEKGLSQDNNAWWATNGASVDDPIIEEISIDPDSDLGKWIAQLSSDVPEKVKNNAHSGLKLMLNHSRGEVASYSDRLLKGEPLTRADLITMRTLSQMSERFKPEHRLDDGGVNAETISFMLAGGLDAAKWADKTLAKIDEKIFKEPKIQGKRASAYIAMRAKDLETEMRVRMEVRSDKMLEKVESELRSNNSNVKKRSVITDITMPGSRDYKKFLTAYLGETGIQTQKDTLEEVGKSDLKLSKDDFDGLPRKARSRIKKEIELAAQYQDADIEKMVYFAVNDELDKGTSVAEIVKKIKKQRAKYLAGGLIFTAATNIVSKVVNGVRNDVFQAPDVMSDIESFVFVNHDPKSAICQNLAGRVFSKEEYESSPYLPPLHHNCKSTIKAQTKGKAGNKPVDIKGLTPSGTDEELEKILKSNTL